MDQHQERIEAATKRKDALQRALDRAEGRLEAARQDLAKVEAECEKKKLAPAQLGVAITKLEARLEQEMTSLEEKIAHAEAAVAPYVEETQ